MKINRGGVFAAGVQNICFCTKSACQGRLIVKFAGNAERCLSQSQGALNVHADLLAHLIGKLRDRFRIKQGRMSRDERADGGVIGQVRQLRE